MLQQLLLSLRGIHGVPRAAWEVVPDRAGRRRPRSAEDTLLLLGNWLQTTNPSWRFRGTPPYGQRVTSSLQYMQHFVYISLKTNALLILSCCFQCIFHVVPDHGFLCVAPLHSLYRSTLTNYKALCELIFISFSSLSFHCAPCSGHLTSVQYLSS